ncbi:hypothetical protein F4777DRAFT_110885 [Nemania sp. FL0916]|nr:hypothetical protein F4777DRAFT_110885 [Nemania sp. FL0916]
MGWDASTSSAVAALIVALLALFVALAQATQQYLITGQLIRLCDGVVYGPLPGQGRRVWQFSQFRFRVLYSIPQISLPAHLWPKGGAHIKSHAQGEHSLPPLGEWDREEREEDRDGYFAAMMNAPPIVIYEEEYRAHRRNATVWTKVQDFFFRLKSKGRRQEESDSDSGDGRSSRSVSTGIRPAKKPFLGFKFPTSLPFPLRRRKPISSRSSSSSISYESRSDGGREARRIRRLRRQLASQRPPSSTDTHLAPPKPNSSHVGEASWVSFCRAIEVPCRQSVRIDFVEYDADRCPSDLISVPMQVSMREVAIMALMAGMEITSASFSDKSISMQGAAGTLTSSNHPILGPILHFTPRNVKYSRPTVFETRIWDIDGRIHELWMPRTWDVCSVAGSFYNSSRRRTVRRLDSRWMRDVEGKVNYELVVPEKASDEKMPMPGMKRAARKAVDLDTEGSTPGANVSDEPAEKKTRPTQVTKVVVHSRSRDYVPERRMQDGDWRIVMLPTFLFPESLNVVRIRREKDTVPEKSDKDHIAKKPAGILNNGVSAEADEASQHSKNGENPIEAQAADQEKDHDSGESTSYPPPHRRATVEDAPDEGEAPVYVHPFPQTDGFMVVDVPPRAERTGDDDREEVPEAPEAQTSERARLARERQEARAERLRQIQEDKVTVGKVMERGAMGSPYEEAEGLLNRSKSGGGPLLLTNYAHNPEKGLSTGPTTEEEAAHEREKLREKERRERDDAREERNRARNRAVGLTWVDMFWLCQTDVMAGSWATPWEEHLPISSALDGAVTVILEALLGFLDERVSLRYLSPRALLQSAYSRTVDWMFEGHYTCPAYGQNARGGIIATGEYMGARVPGFTAAVPVLELLRSYEWQVDSDARDGAEGRDEFNYELMRLDAWLSYVGRLPEIAEGPHDLLRQTPALVQLLIEDFEIDFQNIDLSAREGGLQDIQGLAGNVMDFLTDEELTQPEQLYVLVALLRGVKAAQCVLAGSDTTDLRDILLKDVQAHLV